jgi:hypothetical protein
MAGLLVAEACPSLPPLLTALSVLLHQRHAALVSGGHRRTKVDGPGVSRGERGEPIRLTACVITPSRLSIANVEHTQTAETKLPQNFVAIAAAIVLQGVLRRMFFVWKRGRELTVET